MTSKSEIELPRECPVCGTLMDEFEFDHVRVFCDICGFVIDATEAVDLDNFKPYASRSTQHQADWIDTCSYRNSTEEQVAEAFQSIERIVGSVSISEVVRKETAELYGDAFVHGLTDGRDTTSFVAACIRITSIREDAAIPLGRITSLQGVDSRKCRLSWRTLRTTFDLEPEPLLPSDYHDFLCNEFPIESEQRDDIRTKLERVDGHPILTGKDPAGIAASLLYHTTVDLTQSEVADAVGLTSETIRERLNDVREIIDD